MSIGRIVSIVSSAALLGWMAGSALAQDAVKIGVSQPLTGAFAASGKGPFSFDIFSFLVTWLPRHLVISPSPGGGRQVGRPGGRQTFRACRPASAPR